MGKTQLVFSDSRENSIPRIIKKKNLSQSNSLKDFRTVDLVEKIKRKSEIVIGFTYDAPMFFQNEFDELEGFGYDLGKMLAVALDKKLSLR